ncbi:MAG: hypothetical protein ACK42D_02985 [Candidatus Paceibacteria bacterium]
MKAIIYSSVLFLTPFLSFAGGLADGDDQGGQVGNYINSIIEFINDILFPLALAIAFIFLIWGIVKHFVIGADSDDGKSKGKQLIIYALVGFVVIFSFWGLIKLIQNGLGFTDTEIETNIPTAPGIR